MQFSIQLAALALITSVSAGLDARYLNPNGTNPNVIVKTVTAITIDCPEATVITTYDRVYTVTAPGVLTITDCPCLVTLPVVRPSTQYYTSCPPFTNNPGRPTATRAPAPALTVTPATALFTQVTQAQFTGAANIHNAPGLMLGAVAGVAALAL